MKFSQKLSCVMLLLLAASFALGGGLFVRRNFLDQLEDTARQQEQNHRMQCYALEAEVRGLMARGETVTGEALAARAETLAGYAGGEEAGGLRLVDSAGAVLADTFSPSAAQAAEAVFPMGEADYVLRREGAETYLFLETSLSSASDTYLVRTAAEVTGLFRARDRQLLRLWQMELFTLVLAGAAAVAVSRSLTKPLEQLSRAAGRIADGDYAARTGVETQDEIGQVSRHFDRMAAAVAQNVAALELSVRQRDDFLGAFTHELKTPMTAIIGYADMLRDLQVTPGEQKTAAGYIFSEAKRLELLSRKLLQLEGLAGEAVALRPVRLASVLQSVAAALEPLFPSLRWEISCPPGLTALADEALLQDLVYNLAHNAAKAKPRDEAVHLSARPAAGGVRLCVWDKGQGIPQSELARITEPFYMVDKSRARAQNGSGLGLALCQKIAEAHGTSLAFESAPGKGTAVTVLLAEGGRPECAT